MAKKKSFASIKPPQSFHGVLAVTGNHEFYAGIDSFMELANRSNIKVLRNKSITIADTLQIIGLDDDHCQAVRFPGTGPGCIDKSMRSKQADYFALSPAAALR